MAANNPFNKTKCLQINLGKSKAATGALLEKIGREKIQVVFVQEPHVLRGRVAGFPSRYRIVQQVENPSVEIRSKAAVIITDPMVNIVFMKELSNNICTVVQIIHNALKFFAISIYLPPVARQVANDMFQENLGFLGSVVNHLRHKGEILIAGDINSKSPTWGSKIEDPRGRLFEDFINENNLIVLNRGAEPTFVGPNGSSVIDITLASDRLCANITDWHLQSDDSLSDHKYISWSIGTGGVAPESLRGFCTKNANWPLFLEKFETYVANISPSLEACLSPEDISACITKINTALITAAHDSIPARKKFSNSVPWWTAELTTLRKENNKARKQYQRSSGEERIEKRAAYNKICRNYKNRILETKELKWQEFCTRSSGKNPWGTVYKVLRGKKSSTSYLTSIASENGSLGLLETTRELLGSFFPADNIEEDTAAQRVIRYTSATGTGGPDDIFFSESEINRVIRYMNPKKAPGKDGLTADIIRAAFNHNPTLFKDIYNKCLEAGVFPTCWKEQLIKVIPKPNKQGTSPKDFRPISLLPVAGKILDSLLISRLEYYLYKNNLLHDNQFGFRKGTGTVDAIKKVVTHVTECKLTGHYCAAVALDISGAFDNAWWPLIIQRLIDKQCPDNLIRLARDYFSNRVAIVSEPGIFAEKTVFRGCPQGSKSGPGFWKILYDTIFETDLPEGCEIIAYADDTMLLAKSATYKGLRNSVNSALQTLREWSLETKLEFNAEKTEAIFFGKTPRQQNPVFKLGAKSIYCSETIKYLGVVIDKSLKFKAHVNQVCGKAKQLGFRLGAAAMKEWGLGRTAMSTIYRGAVEPCLLYGAPIWYKACGVKERKKLLSVQRVCTLRASRAYNTVSAEAACVISGLLPVDLRAAEMALRHGLHDLTGPELREISGLTISPEDIETKVCIQGLVHPAELGSIIYSKDTTGSHNVRLFTDGSKWEQGVGAAFVVYSDEREIHCESWRLADYCSVFQAELFAINKALMYVRSEINRFASCSILSDSRSVLDALQYMSAPTQLLVETWEIAREISQRTQLRWHWVRAHTGLTGNERADELARLASGLDTLEQPEPQIPVVYTKISHGNVRSRLSSFCLGKWQACWQAAQNGSWTRKFIISIQEWKKLDLDLSHHAVQLITGHGNFNCYLHRIGRRDSPDCACGEEDTAAHVLFSCPMTLDWREQSELRMTSTGCLWPRKEADLLKIERDLSWWRTFDSCAKRLKRLDHDRPERAVELEAR